MNSINIILLLAISSLAWACKSVNQSNKSKHCDNLIAWNEDTLLKHWFMIDQSNHFTYIVSSKDSSNNIIDKQYTGTVSYKSDTLFLTYTKKSAPLNTTQYLVREKATGSLIQYSLNGSSVSMHISDLRHGDCWF